MLFERSEILETLRMLQLQNLDVRTVTLGINILDCRSDTLGQTRKRIIEKIKKVAGSFHQVVEEVALIYGIPIVNRRIALTPLALLFKPEDQPEELLGLAQDIDKLAASLKVDFVGGFSALIHKGFTKAERVFICNLPRILAATERICASINVASSKGGINVDGILMMGQVIKETAELSAQKDAIACARLVVFANAPEDNPFMAGAFHGIGEPEAAINVGVSGPGVVKEVVERNPQASLGELAEIIKRTAFKITRVGELIGRAVASRLNVEFGIVDLSLAPTPRVGDSVAEVIEAMGIEKCGAWGTTLALALLTDACKKGGTMASSRVGGLSGAFIPVSEDAAMNEAASCGALSMEKLEALTSVCSVGLDMIAIPGDTPPEVISCIIADEIAIGVINHKTTGVRIIPVPGKKAGDRATWGGLLGEAVIMPVNRFSGSRFIKRGGHVPAPITSFKN